MNNNYPEDHLITDVSTCRLCNIPVKEDMVTLEFQTPAEVFHDSLPKLLSFELVMFSQVRSVVIAIPTTVTSHPNLQNISYKLHICQEQFGYKYQYRL